MTAPVFSALGAVASGDGSATVTSPTLAVNDIALAFVRTVGGSPATPSGWTLCAGCPVSSGNLFYNVYWQRASSAGTLTFAVSGTSGTDVAVISSYSGCATTGDPTEAGTGQGNASSKTVSIPALTTSGANRLVVVSGTALAANSAIANTILTGFATRTSATAIMLGDGSLAAAGTSGTSSYTIQLAGPSDGHAIALVPAPSTGAISGSANLSFAATANGSAIGALIGSAGLALAASAVIAAAGALSGSANLSTTATATPSALAAISGSAPLTFIATATPGTKVAIAGTAPLTFTEFAQPSATGRLSGASSLDLTATGTLRAIGRLSGNADLQWTAMGAPDAMAAISGQADLTFTAQARAAQDYTPDPHYFGRLTARSFYAKAAMRSFYAAASARSFYAKSTPDMTVTLSTKDPRESQVVTLDATDDLDDGQTLTSVSKVEVAMFRGTDPNPSGIINGDAAINVTKLIVDKVPNVPNNTVSILPNCGVQVPVAGGLSGCWYLIAITCTTSDAKKGLTLKAVLPVSAQ